MLRRVCAAAVLLVLAGLFPACAGSASDRPSTLTPSLSVPASHPAPSAVPITESRATNVALGKPVTASAALPDQPPELAVDGDSETSWSAGSHPTQWIEIDLGGVFDIAGVRLTIAQYPDGATVHRVWGGDRGEDYRLLRLFSGQTAEDQVLEAQAPTAWSGIRYVKVETTVGPSWVAWREIQVFGLPSSAPPEGFADVILKNGELLTMDDPRPWAQAIAIAGDRILAVGSDAEVQAFAGPQTQIIDLEGRTVTPGFVDAHSHRLGDLSMLGVNSVEEAIESGIRLGWTSDHELTVNQERLAVLRQLDREARLRIRVAGYLQASWEDAIFDWYKQYTPHEIVSPYLQFPGVKLRADQEWGEWVYFDEATLTRLVVEAVDLGWQVAMHSFAAQSNEMVLNAFEQALDGESNDIHRLRLEHTGVVTDEQLERMRRLGIIASVPTAGAQFYAEDLTFEKYIPPELQPFTARTRDFLDAGVPTVGHTDVPWSSFDWRNGIRPTHLGSAMWAIQSAVTRQDPYSPRPLADWKLAQRVTVDEALQLHTIYAAYASFDEERLGSLTPGKLADLVILSANPKDVPVDEIVDIDVLMTMIGGRVEWCAPGAQALCPSDT